MNHVHGGDIYRYRGCLDFSSNINPLGTPASVKKAVKDSAEHLTEYPEPDSLSLCRAVAEAEKVPEDHIICGNGAAELIFSVVRGLKPRRALVTAPSFAEYEQALSSEECKIDRIYLKENNDFCMDQGILNEIHPDTDLVFLCNPNNPTGMLTERSLLLKILQKCRESGTLLFLDECFADFTVDPENVFMRSFLRDYPNLFILKAFTKRFGMAGVRLGYGMCSDLGFLNKIRECNQTWNVSVPAQAAGMAALKERPFFEKGKKIVLEEKPFLWQLLEKEGFKVYPSEANYLFFRGREDLFERMLEQKILIRDCSNYQGLCKGYYRIAVRCHEDNKKLAEALYRIREEGSI